MRIFSTRPVFRHDTLQRRKQIVLAVVAKNNALGRQVVDRTPYVYAFGGTKSTVDQVYTLRRPI